MTRLARIPLLFCVLLVALPAGAVVEEERPESPPVLEAAARADIAWAERDEGRVEEAIRLYEAALAEDPSLEIRWKLARALQYRADFVLEKGDERRRQVFERARDVTEAGIEELAERLGGRELHERSADALARVLAKADEEPATAARLYFWAAVSWGGWSRTVGLLAAIREGVAGKLHRYAEVAVALEPDYQAGSPLLLLGRLHAELPRIPLLSGWVDRDRAVPLMERAAEVAPQDPRPRLVLGLTLLDVGPDGPERRERAVGMLSEIARLEPRPGWQAEDRELRRQAISKLERVAPERLPAN